MVDGDLGQSVDRSSSRHWFTLGSVEQGARGGCREGGTALALLFSVSSPSRMRPLVKCQGLLRSTIPLTVISQASSAHGDACDLGPQHRLGWCGFGSGPPTWVGAGTAQPRGPVPSVDRPSIDRTRGAFRINQRPPHSGAAQSLRSRFNQSIDRSIGKAAGIDRPESKEKCLHSIDRDGGRRKTKERRHVRRRTGAGTYEGGQNSKLEEKRKGFLFRLSVSAWKSCNFGIRRQSRFVLNISHTPSKGTTATYMQSP